ncbi:MAG: DUF3267 domain-containing protein [Spirochaetales bacterium]|nr:DUF3267 domain-containing protein [Spirochaetales bacterium]
MENYYKTLPEGYREVKVVDAKEKKTSVLFIVFSFVLTAIPLMPVLLTAGGGLRTLVEQNGRAQSMIAVVVFLASLVLYLVLHELVHGAVYKALTHQKLTFGFTLTVAFCGVPDVYTSRKTALLSLLAPFVTFSFLLIPLTLWFYSFNRLYYLLSGILFSVHFGGCVGDLYMTYLLLFKYKDPRTLMNDTGPKQTIYLPEN